MQNNRIGTVYRVFSFMHSCYSVQLGTFEDTDNYESLMKIDTKSLSDGLTWWEKNIVVRITSIKDRKLSLTIFSDASRTGCGISCEGKRIHGHWKVEEK